MKVLFGCPLKSAKVKRKRKNKNQELSIKELGEKHCSKDTLAEEGGALKQAAQARGIPTDEEYEDILEGWLGKT